MPQGITDMPFQIGDTAFFSEANEAPPGYGRVVQKMWDGKAWVECSPEFMDEYILMRPFVAHFRSPISDPVKWADWFTYVALPHA